MERLAIEGEYPVRTSKIYYGFQWIDDSDISAVEQVLRSSFITCGPRVEKLERSLCDYTGAKYALAVNSGTSALHCACVAAGIGPGDEVITSPLTFAASANCVLYCGGKPVFADIDPDKIREKITDRTKAIIAVDFLETIGCEAYKIAGFELVDIPLIKYAASKGKPMIMSCGMASPEEIGDAVDACLNVGNDHIVLLNTTITDFTFLLDP